MEEALLDRWSGNKSSDYERACTVPAYLERIEVGSRYGLVLGDMPLSTCIEKDKTGVLCIVRAVFLDCDDDVYIALHGAGLSEGTQLDDSVLYEIKGGAVYLFDAALTGHEAKTENLQLFLAPGRYRVTAHAIEQTERVSLVIQNSIASLMANSIRRSNDRKAALCVGGERSAVACVSR
jgi:hypothetical protein